MSKDLGVAASPPGQSGFAPSPVPGLGHSATTPNAESIARDLPEPVRRAVLAAPFNSKGSGFRGGQLAQWNQGNGHMGGKPALFIRKHACSDYSGDYSLTELGWAVRRFLERWTAK